MPHQRSCLFFPRRAREVVYCQKMRKTVACIFFLIGLGLFSWAQQVPPAACPTIHVSGPAGIVPRGQLATYTANVSNPPENRSVSFLWSISVGQIVEGQGTNSIKVLQPDGCITVTVEVTGLSSDCPS